MSFPASAAKKMATEVVERHYSIKRLTDNCFQAIRAAAQNGAFTANVAVSSYSDANMEAALVGLRASGYEATASGGWVHIGWRNSA